MERVTRRIVAGKEYATVPEWRGAGDGECGKWAQDGTLGAGKRREEGRFVSGSQTPVCASEPGPGRKRGDTARHAEQTGAEARTRRRADTRREGDATGGSKAGEARADTEVAQ